MDRRQIPTDQTTARAQRRTPCCGGRLIPLPNPRSSLRFNAVKRAHVVENSAALCLSPSRLLTLLPLLGTSEAQVPPPGRGLPYPPPPISCLSCTFTPRSWACLHFLAKACASPPTMLFLECLGIYEVSWKSGEAAFLARMHNIMDSIISESPRR